MQLSDAHLALLNSILDEWNKAEQDIKLAEQICNLVVTPAIKELRYGGRRIVEALTKIAAGAPDGDVTALLQDAKFDCHRARHDAIDAGVSKISLDLEVMIDKLGYENILPAYSHLADLVNALSAVKEKIGASRANRENREAIYAVIEAADFAELVSMYRKLMGSEKMMTAMARRARRSDIIGVVGAVFGVAGLIAAIYFWLHP